MKSYCQECGHAYEYTVKKPNFCYNCGNSIVKLLKPLAEASKSSDSEDEDHNYEGEGEEAQVPDINKLDFDFEPPSLRGIKLGSIMGTQPGEEKFERPEEKLSKKKLLEEYKKEAGAIRPNFKPKKKKNE